MTNIEESSEPYFRLLAESDASSDDISHQIALLFRLLYSVYPEPVVEPAHKISALDMGLAGRIIDWLKAEHFIKVEGNQIWLTFTGCETVRAVCRLETVHQEFFNDPGGAPPARATELVLALLRTHFDGGRASGCQHS